MIQHELKYLLALQKVQGMGLMTKKVLLQEFGSARRVFEEINSMRLSTYTKRKVMNNIRSFNN